MPDATSLPLNKFEIIEALEGRLVQTLNGQWHKVEGGHIQTEYGPASLIWYEVGQLEVMLRTSRKAETING